GRTGGPQPTRPRLGLAAGGGRHGRRAGLAGLDALAADPHRPPADARAVRRLRAARLRGAGVGGGQPGAGRPLRRRRGPGPDGAAAVPTREGADRAGGAGAARLRPAGRLTRLVAALPGRARRPRGHAVRGRRQGLGPVDLVRDGADGPRRRRPGGPARHRAGPGARRPCRSARLRAGAPPAGPGRLPRDGAQGTARHLRRRPRPLRTGDGGTPGDRPVGRRRALPRRGHGRVLRRRAPRGGLGPGGRSGALGLLPGGRARAHRPGGDLGLGRARRAQHPRQGRGGQDQAAARHHLRRRPGGGPQLVRRLRRPARRRHADGGPRRGPGADHPSHPGGPGCGHAEARQEEV
ncbi:MAG: hypothetical protein AVDCRST_MAG48-1674, partial [uncultured Friedmanniella sp.]